MPASYPTSAKTFTTKSDGAGNTILAAHINDLQLEVTAIEQDLIAGLAIGRGGTGATAFGASRVPYMNAGNTALTSVAGFTFDGTTLATLGQIGFPSTQSASTNANTLDDYEEGDWTPVIGGGGGQSGQAYSIQVGKYVKIGKIVFCQFRVQLSTLGTVTGTAGIAGLPFTSENTTNQSGSLVIGFWQNLTTAVVHLSGEVGPNSTFATLRAATAAATSLSSLAQADLANTTYLDGYIAYRTTA